MSDDNLARRLRPAALAAGLLLLTAALAALGGWLWWKWWSPAPQGQIYERRDGTFDWYATPLDPGQAHVTAGTFEYVALGFGLALVVGLVAALLGRNRALLALAVTIVSGALGAWLMWRVGVSLSPPDPHRLADHAHFGKKLAGHLAVSGWTPFLAWPVGALLGFMGVMLAISGERPPEPVLDRAEVGPSPYAEQR